MKRTCIIISGPLGTGWPADKVEVALKEALRRYATGGRESSRMDVQVMEEGAFSALETPLCGNVSVICACEILDSDTIENGTVGRLATVCRLRHLPLVCICRRQALPAKLLRKAGISEVWALDELLGSPEAALESLLSPDTPLPLLVAGCDEAGRGPLAGPVFAAAVILPEGFYHPLLNDSKQMREQDRDMLREIIEREAVAWCVTPVSAEEIDRVNILNASLLGMRRSLDGLHDAKGAAIRPDLILVDGNKFNLYTSPEGRSIPHRCVVKGDGRFAAVAAASVLAKTYRDEYMRRLALQYPQYGWDRNMGYPTPEHREAIRRFGPTPEHRKSFKWLPEEENLLF